MKSDLTVVTYWENMVQSDKQLDRLHFLYSYLISRGINVLNNKTELEKVLAKQWKASEQKSGEAEKEVDDEFQRLLSERAKIPSIPSNKLTCLTLCLYADVKGGKCRRPSHLQTKPDSVPAREEIFSDEWWGENSDWARVRICKSFCTTKRGEEGISVLRYFCDIEHPFSFTSLLITLTYQS